jgi:hypothetical protein
MTTSRFTLPPDVNSLLRSELVRCIEEACLGENDTLLAKRYLIDRWPQIDIAAEMGWTRSTVSAHIPRIVQRVQSTAHRLNMT